MRLWHRDLIHYLPRQQLLGQWRECCLIAKQIDEKGTPNHVLVNRILDYSTSHFYTYCNKVMFEMDRRGYRITEQAKSKIFFCKAWYLILHPDLFSDWHNDRYLRQCLANLQEKADCGAIPAEEWKRITDRYPEMI